MGSADRPGRAAGSAGARGAILLVIALILGIILLQKLDTGSGSLNVHASSGTSLPGLTVTTTKHTTTTKRPTVSVLPTSTTRALRNPDQIKVLAANGTNTTGLAGSTKTFLINNHYNALTPVDATKKLTTTLIEYKPDFGPEAAALASLLQLPATSVRPMEDSPPVSSTSDADILVIIGDDLHLPTK